MFKIKTIRKKAEIFFSDGSRLSGSFFVSPRSSTHTGNEFVYDLLTTNNSYLPFELTGNEIILLHKRSIVMALLEDNELSEDPLCRKQIEAHVCFISGETLDGKIYTDLPESHSRLSDFLNRSKDFFHLKVDDRDYLLNSQFIKMVRPSLSQ